MLRGWPESIGIGGRLPSESAADLPRNTHYERKSTIITSNRHITEWVSEWVNLFDDSILAKSALDRLAHKAHQMIIEGESYRKKRGP